MSWNLSRWSLSLFVIGLALTGPAAAKFCGDDVGGRDVPCACGDVLVSDLTLADDPITRQTCAHDGLVVRADEAGASIEIDLAGRTLRGTGAGVGLRVLTGGPGGVRIVSRGGAATLDGFDDGIAGRGPDGVALVQDVVIRGSRRDGLRLTGQHYVLRRITVDGAGRDGLALGGAGFEVTDTRALDCRRYGYFVMGDSGVIGGEGAGNIAERSGTAGFSFMGAGHTLAACRASGGRKDGVALHAVDMEVRGCEARDNGGDGIAGVGSRVRLQDNAALNNGGDGLLLRGAGLIDAGGNRGSGNRGGQRQRGVVQCAVNGVDCAL
jgi:hypothetical protein